MMGPEPDDTSLTPDELRCIERACDAFEHAWQGADLPTIELFLAEAPVAVRTELLHELLEIEVAYRRRKGENPTLAEYHARFPDQLGAFPLRTETLSHRAGTGQESTEDHLPPPAPVAASPTPSIGPTVPGYEIEAELGRGGMGVVYKAKQLNPPRLVALKMIRDGYLAGPEQFVRFRIEAEAAARCQHPNLMRIYEVGENAGLPYFSMELGEAGSLEKKLAGEPLPQDEAARLVRTLADAIQYAHEKKIVHRDLKPANVVLTADGRPLITDFGLAKRLDGATVVTGSRAVLGTASYMAPEQAAGEARHVGPPADIYSLGAILYELLTGKPPFRGASWEATIEQVLHDDPMLPTQLRPGVAPALENVCLKCLEKEAGHRYASARELAEDLGRYLAGESVMAAPSSDWERQVRWARQAGFEIEDVLTYGVRDAVYRARQVHHNRVVALKIVTTPTSTDPAVLARLREEAEVVAKLDHPNIVRIYNSGELRGRTYLAFEYLAGGSLIERFVDEPVPAQHAAHLLRQIAEAIHYAHQHGVLHCALKPSNVLLTVDGLPKITNFGLSILLEHPATCSKLERRLPFQRLADYQAPELVDGRMADVAAATDVYALGAILYKLLTGDPPFIADTVAATADLVRSQPAPQPSRIRGNIPAALDSICLRCLAKLPQQRFDSAGELANELGRFLARTPLRSQDLPKTATAGYGEASRGHSEPTGLLRGIWDQLDPGLQEAFLLAYNKKLREGGHRISTRDLFQALMRIQDDHFNRLAAALPEGALPEPAVGEIPIARHVLDDNPPLSDCVAESLNQFRQSQPLPRKLAPADIFVDIGMHGHGPSVSRLREHGVSVEELERQVRRQGVTVLRRRE
jgi:serine/threonine protein kinase